MDVETPSYYHIELSTPPEVTFDVLSQVRARLIEGEYASETNTRLFWPLFQIYHMVEEASWINKERALPLAYDLVAEIQANDPVGETMIPLEPTEKIYFYHWLIQLDIFDEAEATAIGKLWKEAINEIDEPFEQISQRMYYAFTLGQPSDQKEALWQAAEEIESVLPDPLASPDYFTEQMMQTLLQLQNGADKLGETGIKQLVADYVISLYENGIIYQLSPFVTGYTFTMLAKSGLEGDHVDNLVCTTVTHALQSLRQAVYQLILSVTDNWVTVIEEEELPDISAFVEPFSGFSAEKFRTWLEKECHIHSVWDPDREEVQAFEKEYRNFNHLAQKACFYYLDHRRNITVALDLWRLMTDFTSASMVMSLMQQYALDREDFSFLQAVEAEFVDRWNDEAIKEIAKDHIETGYDLYVGYKAESEDGVRESLHVPRVIEILKSPDSLNWHELIKAARNSEPDSMVNRLAIQVLDNKLKEVKREGGTAGSSFDDLRLAKVLRYLLYWQTQAGRG